MRSKQFRCFWLSSQVRPDPNAEHSEHAPGCTADRVHPFRTAGITNESKCTVFVKNLLQPIVIHVIPKVLDVDVGELFSFGPELGLPLLTRFEAPHKPEGGGRAAQTHSCKTVVTKGEKNQSKPGSISFDFQSKTGCPGLHVKTEQQKPEPANTKTGTTSTRQIHSYASSRDSSFLG